MTSSERLMYVQFTSYVYGDVLQFGLPHDYAIPIDEPEHVTYYILQELKYSSGTTTINISLKV